MASNLPVCLCRAPFGEDHAADCPHRPRADDALLERFVYGGRVQGRMQDEIVKAGVVEGTAHPLAETLIGIVQEEIARLRALSEAVPTISEEREEGQDTTEPSPLERITQRARDYSEAYERYPLTREQILVQAQLDALDET